MNIPAIYQYYPSLPLSELSDLYSAGDNTLNGQRACIISHLPKTLRTRDRFPFNNAYVLFIENTTVVDSIDWSVKLYNRNEELPNIGFAEESGNHTNRFTLSFTESAFSGSNMPQVDKLKITCVVKRGANKLELSVQHNFALMINVENSGLSGPNQSAYFAGNPFVTNYLMNHLKDYLLSEALLWNNSNIDLDADDSLRKIVTAIIYNNVTTAGAIFPVLGDSYDLNEYNNTGIYDLINENKVYEGSFINGICRLPLHILNDAMDGTNTLPNFENISDANPVYQMILHEPPAEDENDDEYMNSVSANLAASKRRLTDNRARLTELYNLTMFPKPAIKLTAILIKFLFECSKKNECKDCKNKFITWPHLPLIGLKYNRDFLKNTLTHYFNRPAKVVPNFATKAVITTNMVWGPAIHTITHVAPRITKAYFATRFATLLNATDRVFEMDRIDNQSVRVDDAGTAIFQQPDFDTALGRQVFVVVETLHARGKTVSVAIKPSATNIAGNTNALEVLNDRDVFVTQLTEAVGDTRPLHNHDRVIGTDATRRYFKIDNADKAIFEIVLRPEAKATFNTWTDTLALDTANLELHVKFEDETPAYFGSSLVATQKEASFLNASDPYDNTCRFRVVNRAVYEIFHEGNRYKHLIGRGVAVDRLGRIENHYIDTLTPTTASVPGRKASYFYHDEIGNEHYFGDFETVTARRWIPHSGGPATQTTNVNDVVFMADATQLQEYNRRGLHVSLFVNTTDRQYIALDCFASLLGSMAVNSVYNLGYNGFSAVNGESIGGSVSHINGSAGDLRYITTGRDGGPCLLTDADFDYPYQTLFVESLFYYGWSQGTRADGSVILMLSERFLLGGVTEQLPHTLHFTTPRHNNHLHVQGFLTATVEVMNP